MSSRTVAFLLLGVGAAWCARTALAQQETPVVFAPVPKFAIESSPIALVGDARLNQYLGVVGRRAAWLGTETGEAELWVHPLKLVSGFRLDFQIPDYADPVRGADVARRIEVRPELTTITYSHATFTVREHILVPLDLPGILVLLDVDAVRPLDVIVSFRNVFQYAWPGGMGGQYASWQPALKAFLMSESLRERNGYLGSPWATTASSHPAHALPDAPSVFRIPVDASRARREFVPIVIAAGTLSREDLLQQYRGLVERAPDLYRARVAHAARLREQLVSISTPDARLDRALEWAKVDLDDQWVCNPDLGCGPVAGWGPSGQSTRPGFGWFFGGDAAINSLAMSSIGLHDLVADGLRFFAKYQRADGKIPHEISQSAARIPWFTAYPYAYYHADTTPYWIVALWQHWRATGDDALVSELWPAVEKAWAWCQTTETDGDGLMENTTAGLGAIEVGAIGENIHEDIYLAAVWIAATQAMVELATRRGDTAAVARARALHDEARTTLNERFWLRSAGHHAFGILASGNTNDALTVWPATAAALGLLDADKARQTLVALASDRITTDWGGRMLSTDHPLYDPLHYNMGAVWPFVTGFLAWGHYEYDRPWAGYPLVDALARLTFDWARGRHPELLSGAFYRPLDTAVPHQFFATSMMVTPLLRGVLGWSADAPVARARLAPQLPPSWSTAEIRRLPAGRSRVDATFARQAGRLIVTLRADGERIGIDYVPSVPVGARQVRTTLAGLDTRGTGTPRRFSESAANGSVRVDVGSAPVTLTTTWTGGFGIEPPTNELVPGQSSRGLRILDVVAHERDVKVDVEGLAGAAYELVVFGHRPASVDGASITAWEQSRGRLRLQLPTGSTVSTRATIVLTQAP